MSGPVTSADVDTAHAGGSSTARCVEISAARATEVGGLPVRRALPKRGRRTVGAWCFADLLGPADLDENLAVEVGPHPHIGLQTVTWLHAGHQVHRDSLGCEQLIRPGQLNLMTAGYGVTHAEESQDYRGEIAGVQLWVALPEHTRHGAAAFEHHGELPELELPTATASLMIGEFGGMSSPARHDTPLVGLDLQARAGDLVLPLREDFEYALIVTSGAVAVADAAGPGGLAAGGVPVGALAYLGTGRSSLALQVGTDARLLLLGGEPFESDVFMWWNFVARSRDEVEEAYSSWASGSRDRFGRTASSLPRIPAPEPWWRRASPSS